MEYLEQFRREILTAWMKVLARAGRETTPVVWDKGERKSNMTPKALGSGKTVVIFREREHRKRSQLRDK